MFRGYSQHLEIKASFPTGWQSLHSTTVLPAGKRSSSVHLPSHVLLPSPRCQQQPLASQGRKPVQQPALEKQPSSPQNTLVFNEIRCLKARLHFSAAFQTLISTNSLSFYPFFFSLYTLEMVKLPLFHRALLLRKGRGNNTKEGSRPYPHGQSQP